MARLTRMLATSAIALAAATTSGHAGGFQRGTADTDILFERGGFSLRSGLTYVNPNRGFETINGVSGDFGTYTGNYQIPSHAVYFGGDAFGCAGTMTESFAAEANYENSPGGALPAQVSSFATPPTSLSRTRHIDFYSNEFGATCRASYSTEKSRFSLLGGLFVEDLHFDGSSFGERNLNGSVPAALRGLLNQAGAQLILPSAVDVGVEGGYKTGYRLGAAYEMPEIALRAQVLYRSEVVHDDIEGNGSVAIVGTPYVRLANGTQVPLASLVGAPTAGAVLSQLPGAGTVFPVVSSLSDSTSPQSLTLSAQTGIAEGTLLLASLRWTDWSTNGTVVSTISSAATGTSFSTQPYNWRDGYTASLGLGRAFNEKVSGVVALGYDRGVSTGADTTYTDLYTLSAGVSLKPEKWGELRFGGLIGYWTSGSQSIADGAYFDATVDDTIVLAGSASFRVTF